uniref:Ankyrin repeat protein n=1 Tax=Bionectria ochroleuca TaxID=29856 RepID=A0A8H7NC66_BIOOC
MPNVPTTCLDQSDQPVVVPTVQSEVGEAVAEALPSLRQFILNVPKQSDGSLSTGDSEKLGKILEGMSPEEVNAKDDGREEKPAVALELPRGFVETTTELLEHGAREFIDARNRFGQTALHFACRKGRSPIVKVLLEYEAKTNIVSNGNRSPIFDASSRGHLEIVQLLLSHKSWDKALLGKKSQQRDGPLHAAVYKGHDEIAEKLLESGSKLGICDIQGWTPLMAATKQKSVGLMKLLLEPSRAIQDRQLEKPDKEKFTPLRAAVAQGFLTGVDMLIKAGAKCTSINLEVQELLSSNEEFIKEDSNRAVLNPETLALLLRTASRWRYEKIVEYVLRSGNIRDCNTPNEKGWSGLTNASLYGHAKIVDLFLENETKVGLSQEEKGQALQAASKQGYDNIVKRLTGEKVNAPIDFKDQEGMTALHHAVRGDIHNVEKQDEKFLGPSPVDKDEENHTGPEPGKHDDVVQLLLDAKAKPGQKTKEGETALHLAVRGPRSKRTNRVKLILEHMEDDDVWAVNNKEQTALSLAFEAANTENQEEDDGHNIARLILLKRKVRTEHSMESVKTNDWSAIELAAYHALPEVLALLLINSTSMKETMKCVDSAKTLVAEKMSRKREFPTKAKSRTVATASMLAETSEHNEDDSEDDQDDDDDSKPSEDHNGSDDKDKGVGSTNEHLVMDILNDPQIVTIKDSESYEFPRPERGVEGFLKDHSASIFQFYADEKESSIIQRFRTIQQFTWVHLSSTNMIWMEDALKRILKDEGYSKDRFQTIKSFFQDSWAEIPDKTSPSRFMRPQHSYKSLQTEKNDQDGRCTALYIPYLSFARYCRGQCSDHSENSRGDDPREKRKRQKLHEESRRCQELLEAYRNRVIHGPSTLDEWYYHFEAEVSSSEDKQRRNETQVVTKSLRDNTSEGHHWRLVRVNQLWAWVIGNKWLITATWDPIDGTEETLPQGIIDDIRKQSKIRGKRYQPYSPFYMSKLLVDYCIGSYERARIPTDKDPEHEQQVSIRQIFSNYINTIGRDETALFERFSKFSLKTNDRHGLEHLLLDNEIRKATEEAKRMSCEIKDIRDELNILKSVAQFQRDVEQKLSTNDSSKTGSRNSSLRANYVVEDVSQMDRVSLRIQSSISETLSLEQSEIANLQATLSVEQGKTLMAFTIVTVVFLPLSFLATFFAMDTESFQKSAWWAKLAVFLLSFGLFILFPFIFRPISQLTTYMLNKDKRGKKLPVSSNRSTDHRAKPIDLGSRTPAEVEEAVTARSITKGDKLARRFRKSD